VPDRDLLRLANGFVSKTIRLELAFLSSSSVHDRAFAAISLYAVWEEYSRRLVYSSAYAQPRTGGGISRTIARAPGISNISDLEQKLRKWKRLQPQYRLIVHLGAPSQMVRACQHLSLTNEQVISPAILSQNSPADRLRIVRNFLAHQNPDTASQVAMGPLQPRVDLTSVVGWLGEKQSGGRTRFGVWASDLGDVARACAS
jgi:hypothetical protein